MGKNGWAAFVSNGAVLIQYNGTKVLIDGLYRDDSGYFSQLPDAAWKTMQRGEGELAHIDYLLFTHSHWDHFYEPYVLTYLQKNRVKGYCLPHTDRVLEKCPVISFDGEGKAELGGDITCRYLDIRHLDPRFYDVVNRCYLLEMKGKHFLFTGDADYQEEVFTAFSGEEIDVAFVTPVFYNHPKGRRILQELLSVKKVVIYHLPFPEEDGMQMEKMARRDMERHGKAEQPVVIWNKTGQSMVF